MLIPDEQKSFRQTLHEEGGLPVLSLQLSCGEASVTLSLDYADREAIKANRDEYQAAVTAFLTRMNDMLEQEGHLKILS